jgi:hypothetical protein
MLKYGEMIRTMINGESRKVQVIDVKLDNMVGLLSVDGKYELLSLVNIDEVIKGHHTITELIEKTLETTTLSYKLIAENYVNYTTVYSLAFFDEANHTSVFTIHDISEEEDVEFILLQDRLNKID